ncbi:endonuclease/exonuclease/phosphatase family protein [Lujinxingia sediminis]|uniref:Endonuclease/exonuclease/phosphatase family protein n=2 Tax=Lujinxingia sediminis TaxID=2480984 RepID=A0ABY0CQP6_9DELT|nr:endonuclease/exonuclease/phosphatase family protein [Lujinxingia sediminis]
MMRVVLTQALATALWGCDPFNATFDEVEDAQYYEAQELIATEPPRGELVVMDWNIKFGGARIDFWFDCHGDRVLMDEDEVLENMEGLATKIRQVDPDVLLMQEIDIDSKRVAYVDQVQWLLDNTELNYAVFASQWRAHHVPTDGIGRVNMGNAILSKYPIRDAQRIAMPQISTNDALTNYFYLKRHILTSIVEVPEYGDLHVLNVHTDAFAQDGTKELQIDLFKDELDRIDRAGGIFVAGGDLNTLPPGSAQQNGFPDSICESEDFQADDFRAEEDALSAYYEDYTPAIPLEDYQADNSPYFTHSTQGGTFWNRKLDYLFTNGTFVPGSGLTHQNASSGGMETMPLSDHAPITVRFALEER